MTFTRIDGFRSIPPALLVLCLLCAATGQAALTVIEEARELKVTQIIHWPLRSGDSLQFRRCSECAIEILKVTDQTRYANGFDTDPITLSELLRQKSLLRADTVHVIAVFYHPEDRRITRLILQTEF